MLSLTHSMPEVELARDHVGIHGIEISLQVVDAVDPVERVDEHDVIRIYTV